MFFNFRSVRGNVTSKISLYIVNITITYRGHLLFMRNSFVFFLNKLVHIVAIDLTHPWTLWLTQRSTYIRNNKPTAVKSCFTAFNTVTIVWLHGVRKCRFHVEMFGGYPNIIMVTIETVILLCMTLPIMIIINAYSSSSQ